MNFCTVFMFFLLPLMIIDTGDLHFMPLSRCEFRENRFSKSHTFSLKAETIFFYIFHICCRILDENKEVYNK